MRDKKVCHDLVASCADTTPAARLGADLSFELLKAHEIERQRMPRGERGALTGERGGTYRVIFGAECTLLLARAPGQTALPVYRARVERCGLQCGFVILIRLRLPEAVRPYFMVPAALYGTNNAHRGVVLDHPGGLGGDPKLDYRAPAPSPEQVKSPGWHFRADRASLPLVLAVHGGQCYSLGIRETSEGDGGWCYNSLGVWTDSRDGDAISIALGSMDWPGRVIHHRLEAGCTIEPLPGADGWRAGTDLFACAAPASDRFAYEEPIRHWYGRLREAPRPGPDAAASARAVGDALVEDGIDPATGYFCMFHDRDGPAKERGDISSPASLLAWAGILQIARPLLRVGQVLGEARYGRIAADMVNRAITGASESPTGLFHDACLEGRWRPNTWWSRLGHTALVNGHACFLVLKMLEDGVAAPSWVEAAHRVLRRVSEHQRGDGRLPSGFSPEDGRPVTYDGFGGCFLVAPLLMARRLLDDADAGEDGDHALEAYWDEFTGLEWIGVDLDCRGAVDCGSSYGLIRALTEQHRQDPQRSTLERLGHALHYACSYRLGHNTRHRHPVCDWSSAGSTVTSTHNVHLDAYGGEVLEEMAYYARLTGDPYVWDRIDDALAWARQAYNRHPGEYGFGKAGWITEQFYHTYDHYHDAEADGAVWRAYFPWAAGSLLNAFALELERRAADAPGQVHRTA